MTANEILIQALKGKSIRYKKSDRNIMQTSNVIVKKNDNVTDKQFATGNPKYQTITSQTKVIGRHTIYEVATIKDVSSTSNYRDDEPILSIELDNGVRILVMFYEEINLV